MTMQRNVRPRLEVQEGDDYDSPEHFSETQSADGDAMEQDSVTSDEEQDETNGEEASYEQQISNVSFGALKQAQDSLSRKRKRGSDTNADQEEKLEALRARLQEIKKAKSADTNTSKSSRSGIKNPQRRDGQGDIDNDDDDDSNSDSDSSDSAPSEEDAPTKSRTSKHAPAAQSTKHQVTRKRTVITVPKRTIRDPRFDALHQTASHPGNNSEKAYSFLTDYQKSEIADLKTALKQTKSEEEKTLLRRKINSMENRLKAKEAKEREQEIVRKHRKAEREKVEQGKNPYFLKKKDVKQEALVEKFKGMKSKEREKVIEKRQRKESQKEKKRMPNARRMVG